MVPTAKDAGPIFGAMTLLIVIPLSIAAPIVGELTAIVPVCPSFPYSAPIIAMLGNGIRSLPIWQAAIVMAKPFVLTAIVLPRWAEVFSHRLHHLHEPGTFRTVLSP